MSKKRAINYLDDFLFAAILKAICDQQVQCFLDVCAEINFPVSLQKTHWGTNCLVFLGLLIDTVRQLVCIPCEKVKRAQELIDRILQKRKVTLHDLQKICGFLNFLCQAILPGRAFTRHLYAYTGGNLKPHHHIKVNQEMRGDLNMWKQFLSHPTAYCHPFLDFDNKVLAQEVDFYSDASRNFDLGMGAICQNSWMFAWWGDRVKSLEPSIEYLELYALCAAVLVWIKCFKNRKSLYILRQYECHTHDKQQFINL